jgi:hypothetical protein
MAWACDGKPEEASSLGMPSHDPHDRTAHLAAVVSATSVYSGHLRAAKQALDLAIKIFESAAKAAEELGKAVRGGAVDSSFAASTVHQLEQARTQLTAAIRSREKYLAALESEQRAHKERL